MLRTIQSAASEVHAHGDAHGACSRRPTTPAPPGHPSSWPLSSAPSYSHPMTRWPRLPRRCTRSNPPDRPSCNLQRLQVAVRWHAGRGRTPCPSCRSRSACAAGAGAQPKPSSSLPRAPGSPPRRAAAVNLPGRQQTRDQLLPYTSATFGGRRGGGIRVSCRSRLRCTVAQRRGGRHAPAASRAAPPPRGAGDKRWVREGKGGAGALAAVAGVSAPWLEPPRMGVGVAGGSISALCVRFLDTVPCDTSPPKTRTAGETWF